MRMLIHFMMLSTGVKSPLGAVHAGTMLKAHSRDLGQRQQLMHAKLHHNISPSKAKGDSALVLPVIMVICAWIAGAAACVFSKPMAGMQQALHMD